MDVALTAGIAYTLVLGWGMPSAVYSAALAGWVTVATLVAFAVYRTDKVRSAADDWRVPEKVLLNLALFGGWPGAAAAVFGFSHKSREWDFLLRFALAVAANLVVCSFLPRAALLLTAGRPDHH